MLSIDQNCHSLWDAIPKLQALTAAGYRPSHFIEDTDVAFTAMGAGADDQPLRLERERYYRSGGADWGAALFYCQFLGRLPVEIRDWEPMLGTKTNALGRQLGRKVDDLYDEFSPSDNWQLIGPSYVGDRAHHRVIGDLSTGECAEFLRRIMARAKADCLDVFCAPDARERIAEWFLREQELLESLLDQCKGLRLVDVYRGWLGRYLGASVELDVSSALFALGRGSPPDALVELYVREYDMAAGLYNQAIAETSSPLRPLRTAEGELPFFAVFDHRDHTVRTGVFLRDQRLHIGERQFKLPADGKLPAEALVKAGVRALVPKAILLVIQVRHGPAGRPLALPYRGSLYAPAAKALAGKLAEARLLRAPLEPLYRVRFRLLDRMRDSDTPIRLPRHLRRYFDSDIIPAGKLGAEYGPLAAAAAERLTAMRDPEARQQWQAKTFPQLFAEAEELDARRRKLAQTQPKSQQLRDLSKRHKAVGVRILDGTLRQIADDYQLARIDYWDSRGALLPWSIALGGADFYNDLIRRAEIYEEPAEPETR